MTRDRNCEPRVRIEDLDLIVDPRISDVNALGVRAGDDSKTPIRDLDRRRACLLGNGLKGAVRTREGIGGDGQVFLLGANIDPRRQVANEDRAVRRLGQLVREARPRPDPEDGVVERGRQRSDLIDRDRRSVAGRRLAAVRTSPGLKPAPCPLERQARYPIPIRPRPPNGRLSHFWSALLRSWRRSAPGLCRARLVLYDLPHFIPPGNLAFRDEVKD